MEDQVNYPLLLHFSCPDFFCRQEILIQETRGELTSCRVIPEAKRIEATSRFDGASRALEREDGRRTSEKGLDLSEIDGPDSGYREWMSGCRGRTSLCLSTKPVQA